MYMRYLPGGKGRREGGGEGEEREGKEREGEEEGEEREGDTLV